MEKTELNLKTVTPMFLRGADNKTPELRPPAFKALFRYWWRTVQNCDTDSLRENEAKLFGSTDGKAPFSIRIGEKRNLGDPIKCSPTPHKGGRETYAYDVEKPFSLRLITKNTPDADYEQIAKLSFLLGGVGNRSRRGAGSIRETCWDFANVSELRDEILDTLNAVAKDQRFQKNSSFQIRGKTVEIIESKWRTSNTSGSAIVNRQYPVIRRIFFGKLTKDLDGLLKEIGNKTSVAKAHNNDFTLGDGNPRMASPVVVRIQKINSQYIPILTQLYPVYPELNPDYDDIRRIPKNAPIKQLKFIDDIIN